MPRRHIYTAGLQTAPRALTRTGGPIFVAGYTFTLRLFRDGRAELSVVGRAQRRTEYRGEVAVWDYGKLCYLAERVGFSQFAQHYEAAWTDSGTDIVEITSGGHSDSVAEYADIGPVEFWGLKNAIDAVKGRIEWKRK